MLVCLCCHGNQGPVLPLGVVTDILAPSFVVGRGVCLLDNSLNIINNCVSDRSSCYITFAARQSDKLIVWFANMLMPNSVVNSSE